MSVYNADEIEQEAVRTRALYKGRFGRNDARSLTITQIRTYCDKVLFLCRELEKAKQKIRKTEQAMKG